MLRNRVGDSWMHWKAVTGSGSSVRAGQGPGMCSTTSPYWNATILAWKENGFLGGFIKFLSLLRGCGKITRHWGVERSLRATANVQSGRSKDPDRASTRSS